MKQKSTFFLAMSGLSFLLFGLLTTLVLLVDVRPVGPGGAQDGCETQSFGEPVPEGRTAQALKDEQI